MEAKAKILPLNRYLDKTLLRVKTKKNNKKIEDMILVNRTQIRYYLEPVRGRQPKYKETPLQAKEQWATTYIRKAMEMFKAE